MDIAGTIRRLRREKDMTQESLASVLGVTYQTVSKWERGESFPDISLLPLIAAVFGTTTDVLLGTDEERQRLRSNEFHKNLDEYRKVHDREGSIKYLRGYVRENREDYGAMKVLAFELDSYSDTIKDKIRAKQLRREAAALYERILEFKLPDNAYGFTGDIKFTLAELLWKLGENDRAKIYAEEFGFPYSTPPDLHMAKMRYAVGLERKALAAGRVLDVFHKFLDAVYCMVDFDDEYEVGFTDAEKLERLKLAYAIVPIIFDDVSCHTESERVAQLCIKIAELYAKTCDNDNALLYLEIAAGYAEEYDGLETMDESSFFEKTGYYYSGTFRYAQHTSQLLETLRINDGDGRVYKEPTASGELLKTHLSRPAFNAIRGDERFQAIVEKLEKAAAEYQIN